MDEKRNRAPVDWIIPAICLVLALATVAIVYYLHQEGTAIQRLTIVVGYVIVILIFFFGLMVLMAMATNKIDLSGLLCEPTENKASMSRFQLLIFTFVIALSLVLIILSGSTPVFPEIPSGVLLLLGISASTYAVSKGINASTSSGAGNGQDSTAEQTLSSVQDPVTGRTTTTLHNHATGQSTTTVHQPDTGQTTTTVNNPTTVTTTTSVSPQPSKPVV
jgi:hypothetical protein